MRIIILIIMMAFLVSCVSVEETTRVFPTTKTDTKIPVTKTLEPSNTMTETPTLTTTITPTRDPTIYLKHDHQNLANVRACNWSFDSKQVAVATDEGIYVYVVENQELVLIDEGISFSLDFNPFSNILAASVENQLSEVKLWNTDSFELIASHPTNNDWSPQVLWLPNGSEILLSFPVFPLTENYMMLAVWETSQWIKTEHIETNAGGLPNQMIFHDSGTFFITASNQDLMVHYWDFPSMTLLADYSGNSVALSSDGRLSAIGNKSQISIIEIPEFKEKLQFVRNEVNTSALLTFSIDAKLLVSADLSLDIWDTTTGQLLKTLDEFEEPVSCLEFSPDGKYLFVAIKATGAEQLDSSIYIWETK